ncbi:MAG TPA: nitroreductase [Saprospiraceae bacterium]|nr:nitroreductase [Saprospiraceae bacterium]HMQ85646.1 nitroreductase [Saprospiraceae bacterium]
MQPEQVNELLRKRRSIFPQNYVDRPIAKEIIKTILENANWAPNHKMTQPWRFKVFQDAALERLSQYLSNWYKDNTPEAFFSQMKYEKTRLNPLRSGAVIAICMQRDPGESLPEWEELAAVACAVQNMWLSCTAYGIGSYWSSPTSIIQGDDFLNLKPGERCLGLFYMGYHDLPEFPGKRSPIEDKVDWLDR